MKIIKINYNLPLHTILVEMDNGDFYEFMYIRGSWDVTKVGYDITSGEVQYFNEVGGLFAKEVA